MIELYKGKNNKSYFVGDNRDAVLKEAKAKLKMSGIIVTTGYVQGTDLYLEIPEGKSSVVWVAYRQ